MEKISNEEEFQKEINELQETLNTTLCKIVKLYVYVKNDKVCRNKAIQDINLNVNGALRQLSILNTCR